ncbi:hypothetical protein ACJX0J_021077, partial [Zea mays]
MKNTRFVGGTVPLFDFSAPPRRTCLHGVYNFLYIVLRRSFDYSALVYCVFILVLHNNLGCYNLAYTKYMRALAVPCQQGVPTLSGSRMLNRVMDALGVKRKIISIGIEPN